MYVRNRNLKNTSLINKKLQYQFFFIAFLCEFNYSAFRIDRPNYGQSDKLFNTNDVGWTGIEWDK